MFDPQTLLDQFLGSSAQNRDPDAPADARGGLDGVPDKFKGFGGGLAAGGLAGLLLGTKGGAPVYQDVYTCLRCFFASTSRKQKRNGGDGCRLNRHFESE